MGVLAAAIAEEGCRLPGDRRLAARAKVASAGLSLSQALHDEVLALGRA